MNSEKHEIMLFDTDILIWVFRGNDKAGRLIENSLDRHISIITYMELLQGARSKKEMGIIREFLAYFTFTMMPLTENIGHRASIYIEEFSLKSGMRIADALIAATAMENSLHLCTGNAKHYKPISDLKLKIFRL